MITLGGTDRYHILQANLQRSKQATADMFVEAAKRKLAFALVQEPYTGNTGEMRNYSGVTIIQNAKKMDKPNKAAILLFDNTIDIIPCPNFTAHNIAVAKLKTSSWEIGVLSIYLEGDNDIELDVGQINRIVASMGTQNVILGGDANAWSTWWGSRESNSRGEAFAGMLDALNFQILNCGTEPTFDTYRGTKRYTSCVDVTACSLNMLSKVDGWRVASDVTCSDHNAILFEIKLGKALGTHIKGTTRIYNTRKANWDQFREKLAKKWIDNNITKEEIGKINCMNEVDGTIDKYMELLTDTCLDTIPKIQNRSFTGLPWWSEELEALKRDMTTKKRRIRCASSVRRKYVVKDYLTAKDTYLLAAAKAQVASWKAFCEKQDRESMWDGVYRVLRRTAIRKEDVPLVLNGKELGAEESAKLLAETFYPDDEADCDNADHHETREVAKNLNGKVHGETCDPPFTAEELRWALDSFSVKKAPGGDGFTAQICGAAISLSPDIFLDLLNKCLELSYFPKSWKEAIIVVLRKNGKEDYTHPKSYRPIGLLPIFGKVLEKMVMRRVKWYTFPDMSPQQYGFTPQRGTEDSLYVMIQYIRERLRERKLITVVSLDIEGAFDNAWWPAIRCRLAESRCPVNLRRLIDSYLSNRSVRLRYAGTEWARETTKGCVQGSVGGPIFWNLLLDPLLKGLTSKGHYCQAFADDVVLIFSGDAASEVQDLANAALAHVQDWGVQNKLQFAPSKTKAMVITNKLKYDSPVLSMGGVGIELSREIKILGLTVDDRLAFDSHVSNVCRRALNFYKQMSRAAKIYWGLQPEIIRTMYVAVVEPTIMYAASAWAPAASKTSIRKQLDAVQRGFVQKMIKSYRTVALNSALLLAGMLPLDLRVQEAASLFVERKGFSRRVMDDHEIEKPVAFVDLPHPAKLMELKFGSVADGEEWNQQNSIGLKIFTDGSKIEGKVGAALSLWDGDVEIKSRKFRLEPFCTVYQAELLALQKAVELALNSDVNECSIYCDSRSVLETVIDSVSLHPLAVKIKTALTNSQKRGKIINLFWIKAHVGLEGNERADELAKDAALRRKTRADYEQCPVSFVKRQIRKETLDEWSRRYNDGKTASTTKLFFPQVVGAYSILKKIELTPILVQVFTGHGGFSEYLNRFKCKESPACLCDPEEQESIIHVLTECPVYGRDRIELEIELGIEIRQENLAILVGTQDYRESFLKYCEKLARKTIKRNK